MRGSDGRGIQVIGLSIGKWSDLNYLAVDRRPDLADIVRRCREV